MASESDHRELTEAIKVGGNPLFLKIQIESDHRELTVWICEKATQCEAKSAHPVGADQRQKGGVKPSF